MGRMDPRVGLMVNSRAGPVNVPIGHAGFVWSAQDFDRLLEPRTARMSRPTERRHWRGGIGVTRVVERRNSCRTPADRFLKPVAHFPATVLLRPDVETWLASPAPRRPSDLIELHDPYRVQNQTCRRTRLPPGRRFRCAARLCARGTEPGRRVSMGWADPAIFGTESLAVDLRRAA